MVKQLSSPDGSRPAQSARLTRTQWLWPVTALATTLVLSLGGHCGSGAVLADNGLSATAAELQGTVLKGLQFRESQLHALYGEAVVDSYYGPAYWPWLRNNSEAVRTNPGKERDRDRTAVRFSLSDVDYRIEAQAIYWGGASLFFASDTDRDAKDTGDLHVVQGATDTGMIYSISRETGYPLASYFPTSDTTSGFCRGRPAMWLGISAITHAPLSEFIREDIDRSSRAEWQAADLDGLPCQLLTLHRRPNGARAERVCYWFAPSHDCALVRKERIGYDPTTGIGQRYVDQWSDFAAVEGLQSSYPRRCVGWMFTYDEAQSPDPTEAVHDIRISTLAVRPPSHPLLGQLALPVGARIMAPVSPEWPSNEVPPEYEREMLDTAQVWRDTQSWARKDWQTVVPGFPDDWAKGIDEATVRDLLASDH